MSLLAPRDNKVIKKEPDEMFPNLWADQDFQIGSLDVSGTLQVQDIIVNDTVVANAIVAYSDIVVNGFIDASGGISFGDEPLDAYEEFTVGFSMGGGATFSATARLTKIGRMICFELLPFTVQNITTSTFISSGVSIPADSRPVNSTLITGIAIISTIPQPISLEITSSGTIVLSRGSVSGVTLVYSAFVSGTTIQLDKVISGCYTVN
jgi:hypothetical protein